MRSIVGRFLEHSRVFWFENAGRAQMYLASADWMERNFFRRIEVAFPIAQAKLRARIREDLERYLTDNTHAWLLQSDGSYQRAMPDATAGDATAGDAQGQLLESLRGRGAAAGVDAQLHALRAQVLDFLVQVFHR